MSNIGKKPVVIKEGATIAIDGNRLIATGPKGILDLKIPRGVTVEIADGQAKIVKLSTDPALEKYSGLVRALLSNMVTGVTGGFEKKLELQGVGYRARLEGRDLVLNVGFALPVRLVPPDGVTVSVAEGGIIAVSGINKNAVGDFAADIRKVRPPDAYKGKGIRYFGEHIRKKAGKAAKAAGAK